VHLLPGFFKQQYYYGRYAGIQRAGEISDNRISDNKDIEKKYLTIYSASLRKQVFMKRLLVFFILILATGCAERSRPSGYGDGGFNDDVTDDGISTMCEEGRLDCLNEKAFLCFKGKNVPVLDCQTEGWKCRDGRCVAEGDETDTEREYRLRLFELTVQNVQSEIVTDSFGGWKNTPDSFGNPARDKYFRTKKINGVWWLITPEGNPFISRGVTDVNYLGPKLSPGPFHDILVKKYGSEEEWVKASLLRIGEWAFNTIGPWSSYSIAEKMPHTMVILDAAGHSPRYRPDDIITDYWSEQFTENVKKVVSERVTPYIQDRFLIGYFLDNELYWVPDWRGKKTLLQLYVDFPPYAPGRKEALKFVKESVSGIDEFNRVFGAGISDWDEYENLSGESFGTVTEKAAEITEAFLLHAFRKYASTAIGILKETDPNHLVLGCRFAAFPGESLVTEAAKYFDVVSMAGYHENWVDELDNIYTKADKPFLIEEFSFKAKDSGLPNVMYYAQIVENQKERALAYDRYVGEIMKRPYYVAYHWYKWFDNPPEDNNPLAGDNFGLMNYRDKPYADFVKMVREVNRRTELWHSAPKE